MRRAVVVGVDAPRAWCLWAEGGPVAAGQVNSTSLSARRDVLVQIELAVAALGGDDAVAVVGGVLEIPYAGVEGGITPEDAAVFARGVGYLERAFEERGWSVTPMRPSEWRSILRFPGRLKKPELKALAVSLAERMAKETQAPEAVVLRGVKGGERVDTCEACCISAAAWVTSCGWTGAMQCWKDKGTFWTG